MCAMNTRVYVKRREHMHSGNDVLFLYSTAAFILLTSIMTPYNEYKYNFSLSKQTPRRRATKWFIDEFSYFRVFTSPDVHSGHSRTLSFHNTVSAKEHRQICIERGFL